MAESLNVSPSYLCKIEKGIQNPTETFKKSCADLLNMTVEELFPHKTQKNNSRSYAPSFANNLWAIRTDKGIKQYKLAGQLGCSPSYLSKVEKGLQVPTARFKKKCARILKIKETYLFP